MALIIELHLNIFAISVYIYAAIHSLCDQKSLHFKQDFWVIYKFNSGKLLEVTQILSCLSSEEASASIEILLKLSKAVSSSRYPESVVVMPTTQILRSTKYSMSKLSGESSTP